MVCIMSMKACVDLQPTTINYTAMGVEKDTRYGSRTVSGKGTLPIFHLAEGEGEPIALFRCEVRKAKHKFNHMEMGDLLNACFRTWLF